MSADPMALLVELEPQRLALAAAITEAEQALAREGTREAAQELERCLGARDAFLGRPGLLDQVLDALLECADEPVLEARLQKLLVECTAAQDPVGTARPERGLELGLRRKAWTWRSPGTVPEDLHTLERRLLASGSPEERGRLWHTVRQAGHVLARDLVMLEQMRVQRARALGYADHRALLLSLAGVDPETLDLELERLEHLSAIPWEQARTALATAFEGPATPCWVLGDTFSAPWPDTVAEPTTRQCLELGRELLESLGLPADVLAGLRTDAAEQGVCPLDGCRPGEPAHPLLVLPGPGRLLPRFLGVLGEGLCLAMADPECPVELQDPDAPLLIACGRLFARLAHRGGELAPWVPAGLVPGGPAPGRLWSLYTLRRLLRDARFEQAFRSEPDQDLDALHARLDREILWGPHHRPGPPGAWAAAPWLTSPRTPALLLVAELMSHQLEETLCRAVGLPQGAFWLHGGPEAGGWLADRLFLELGASDSITHLETLCGHSLDAGALCRALALAPDPPAETLE